jgi:hypothetical protein
MNNTFTKSMLTLAVGGLMLAGSAVAQTSTTSGTGPGVVDPGHPRVNEVNRREQNQQNRIANGMKSGKLSPKQAANLEKREAARAEARAEGYGQARRASDEGGAEGNQSSAEPDQ